MFFHTFFVYKIYYKQRKCWNVGMLEFRQSPIGEIKMISVKKEKKYIEIVCRKYCKICKNSPDPHPGSKIVLWENPGCFETSDIILCAIEGCVNSI